MSAFQVLVRAGCGVQERNIAENGFFENINFQESILADDIETRKRGSLNSCQQNFTKKGGDCCAAAGGMGKTGGWRQEVVTSKKKGRLQQ
ncbi:hypothetical protein ACEN9F_27395 [Duganella sp. CT11-25]|uniref:hypothetical protein n=1 Tax=unclassified Duganella TaxID=2636909 RepID=UPI0039AF2F91